MLPRTPPRADRNGPFDCQANCSPDAVRRSGARLAGPRLLRGAGGGHGDFELEFAGGQRLLVEPGEGDDLESWRLFRPGTDAPHFVVGPQGADPDG